MSIITGIIYGIQQGILKGINAVWGLIKPISKLDFSTPVIQEFPSTAASLATLLGDAAAVPSSLWRMEGSSGNLVDELGNATLVNQGPSALQGQTAVGFHNGTDFTSKKAVESLSNSTRFEEADNTIYDFTTGSFAHLIVFRCKSTVVDQYLFRKRNSSGYYIRVRPGGTLWGFAIGAASNNLTQVVGNHSDGAWHVLISGYDVTNTSNHLHSDYGNDINAGVTLGDMTNTDYYTYFDTALDTQIAYAAVFEGAAAEAVLGLGATAVTNFWKHGSNPTQETIHTLTRNSILSVPVDAENSICHYAPNTVAIGYNPNFTDTNKLGVNINRATTNLVTASELLSSWTLSDMATNNTYLDSPDGFRNANRLTAIADAAYVANTVVTVASTEYTLSVFVKNATTGTESGRLVLYDETGSTEIASQVFTTSTSWQRISLTATTAVGQISSSIRVEIDSTPGAILAWGAQVELGGYMTTYVRALTAATASDFTVLRYYFLAPDAKGEIKSISAKLAVNSNAGIWNCLAAVGNENRRRLITATSTNTANVYDGAGTSEDSVVQAHGGTLAEEVCRVIWDQSSDGLITGGRELVFVYRGMVYYGAASPWDGSTDAGAQVFLIDVGAIGSGGNFNLPCVIQSIESYDDLSEPLPTWDFSSPRNYETDYWDMQTQTVAGKYDNGASGSSATLDNVGGLPDTAVTGLLYTDNTTYNSWKPNSTDDEALCSDSTTGDIVNQDFSVRFVFRTDTPDTQAHMFGKFNILGWRLYNHNGTDFYFTVNGGNLAQISGIATGYDDGKVHILSAFYDHSASMIYLKSDLFTEVSTTVTGGRDFTEVTSLNMGKRVVAAHSAHVNMSHMFAGICKGTSAQAYYNEVVKLPR